MESSCASALPAREPENIEAAGKAREQETKASDPLMVQKARKGPKTNLFCPREKESMGAHEINVPEKDTAAVRRDGEPLASGAMEQRQKEAAADRYQAAAGERPPPHASPGAILARPVSPPSPFNTAQPGL
jgi:hypothetical protein